MGNVVVLRESQDQIRRHRIEDMYDEYMRERAADIKDISRRLPRNLWRTGNVSYDRRGICKYGCRRAFRGVAYGIKRA